MTQIITAAISAALLLAAVVTVLWVLIGAAAVCGAFWLSRLAWHNYRARVDARAHDPAELLARAEIQHQWFMAGDSRGVHGPLPASEGVVSTDDIKVSGADPEDALAEGISKR